MSAADLMAGDFTLPAFDGPAVPAAVAQANGRALVAVADYEEAPAEHREEARDVALDALRELKAAITKHPEIEMPGDLAGLEG